MARTARQRTATAGRCALPDPFYYLNNFRTVLASLERRYWPLLTGEEREFIRRFAVLPESSCALLVRMIMRRGPCFRASRLEYPEIGDVASAAAPLSRIAWLEEPILDVAALQRLLTKAELAGNLGLPRHMCRLSNPQLLDVLREQYPEARPFHGWCPHSIDRVFSPVVKPLAERFRLMFFGNFHQDWTTFVLSELGINSYETVPVHTAPFRTRAHIEAFCQMHHCRQALEEGARLEDIEARIPPAITDSDWLEEHRQRLLLQVAAAYERIKNPARALAVLSNCRYRGARMRTVRVLERLLEWQAASDLGQLADADPESEAERQQIRRVLPRLNRKLGITRERKAELPQVASFEVYLDAARDGRALEFQVRDHLQSQEEAPCSVHYVENGLINSLFGLLCWDAVFAPISGSFFHDYQFGPADLESPYFYERRRDRFGECFKELESGRYKDIIRRRFILKAGIQAPFVAWGLLSARLLECALECFPASHLRLWFEWIVRDVVDNRTGFPDLVQFWMSERRYRMVEVKGPGDRLQDNQRRFLEFCGEHEMPALVCRVSWQKGMAHAPQGSLR